MQRFRDADRQRYLRPMSERILVECPRCQHQAEVLREGPSFACGHCGHAMRGEKGRYAGMARAVVKRSCGWCGRMLARTERRRWPHPTMLEVLCPECSHCNYITAAWQPDPGGEGHDPCFGLGLWLQTRCAGELLWVYNGEHLAFLRDYVGASLRERVPNANGSLASRLPGWIKQARNRPTVLRAVRRLEEKLGG